jgi:exportin-T
VFEGVAAAARYPDDGANEEDDFPSNCGTATGAHGACTSSSGGGGGGGSGSGSGSGSVTGPAVSSGLGNTRAARISGDAAYQAARDEQWEVEERRKELLVLFRNTAKLAFPDALAFVGVRVQAALAEQAAAAAAAAGCQGSQECTTAGGAAAGAAANGFAAAGGSGGAAGVAARGSGSRSSGVKFQDAELAVTLVYELGDGAPEEALRPGSGGLAALVLLLLQRAPASLPAAQHRLVALALLETCVRYCRLLQQQGVSASLPGVLGLFLGPTGLGHPSAAVATRAAYLLSRLVKQLRAVLRAYIGELLRQLQPYLEIVATQPPPSASAAVGTSRDAVSGRAPITAAVVDDRLYVFESVGLLLGQEELPEQQQLAALQQLLQPLTRQIEGNLGPAAAAEAAAAGGGGGSGSGGSGSAWAIQQSLEAIARLNKGFKAELCSKRPQLGAWVCACACACAC